MLTISSHDRTIASLKHLIANLTHQVASIGTRIPALSENAQSAVLAKNRVSALAALRSKKAAEDTLTQRLDTLSQLQAVYDRIEQAVDQVAMIRIMKAGTEVLRSVHANAGGVTNMERVVEQLREEMDEVDKIGHIIEATGQGDAALDEGAIDDELEAMVRQSELKLKESRQIEQRLADIAASRDTKEANQPSEQETQTRSSLSAAETVGSVDTLAVIASNPMSLDESQGHCVEIPT